MEIIRLFVFFSLRSETQTRRLIRQITHRFTSFYFIILQTVEMCRRCGTLDYLYMRMYSPLIGCLPNDTSCQHYFVLDSESFCYGVLCLLSASKWIWPLIADYQVTAPLYIQRPLSKHFRNHQSTLSIHFTYISF